ncbi:hypothetical protein [Oceanirhabdus seepicola]|uniref:Dipeptidylpeptidase IV N-terminal domain-containing protein n=1 Tax=Oceanirhabdus seepicola TaxID=2828781 RepID=A0A9J6P2H4_9CLOT|nr:hypothetical protein [Oceanirhabdus seepicola]MCM1990398.1 hypothetical protein [Oceanirhabdus seepicola]
MNAEKFDIEKMLEADAESIEIDLDFKAKLKANIMKNNSSFENNNIIDFNAKTSGENVNKSKDIKFYRKYLKIASSFAIVGLIGFRVGVGGLGFAKVDNPKDIEVVQLEVLAVSDKSKAASADKSNNPSVEDEIDNDVKEVAINSGNEDAHADKDTKSNNINGDDKVVDEKPTTENNPEDVERVKEKFDNQPDESNNNVVATVPDNSEKVENPKLNIDENHNDVIKNQEGIHYTSPNSSSEEKEKDTMLVSYGEEKNLDLYCGTLSTTEDEEVIIQDNKVFIKNEDLEELIFTQEDNYQLIGIKKVNDSEVLLYKGLLGDQENKTYQLSKLNISSKNEKLLVVEANSISVNNTYDKLAFEINNDIVIKDIETEKEEKTLQGENIAWSPDGKYLSYVKIVQEKEEGEKIKTYSSLVVYNFEENKEIPLTENELIVKNDEELIGTYKYGENLWSNDNECIYVVRDNISIMRDTDGNKKQVIKLTFKK